ncbi:shikimate kinase [Nonomuraea sp. NPDC059023]|uniref:shikimate kinase n=1 Tax=unclassified Nonomuraea TaxID=2593643 RepID=UPI0036A6AD89
MSKNKPVVVIGLMGSGKTTVGKLLARELGVPLSDSDPYLRGRYGASAAEIAKAEGADVLHRREAEHVLHALTEPPQVIAAAASTVEDPRVREALRAAFVVWLDAPDEILAQRMRSSDHRPEFSPSAMRARRGPYFLQLADLRLDVSTATPENTATTIYEAL